MKRVDVKGIGLEYKDGEPVPSISMFTKIFGAIHDIYPRVTFYYTPVSSIMQLAITYKIVIEPLKIVWLTPIVLVLGVISVGILVCFIVWRITIPHLYYYNTWQSLRNGSVITKMVIDRFDSIDKKLDEISKRAG